MALVFTRPVKARHPLARVQVASGPTGPSVFFPLSSPQWGHLCVEGLGFVTGGLSGAACTHLWVRGLLAPRWDHDIQGALEHRGDQWSLGAPGVLGDQLVQAGQWLLVPRASSGEQLTVRFALLEDRDTSSYSGVMTCTSHEA